MQSTKRYPAIALAVIAGLVLAVGIWLGWAQNLFRGVTTAQGPTTDTPTPEPTPDPAYFFSPIYTAQEAISQTLSTFPSDHIPITTTARLVSVGTLDYWRGGKSPGIDDNAPAWLVGVLSSDLRVADILDFYDQDAAISGAYYAWDANSGYMIGVGALGNQWPQNFATLNALQNEPLQIALATMSPSETAEPNPTPTP